MMLLDLGETKKIISCLNFLYTKNKGIAFGFLVDKFWYQRWVLSLISFIIIIILITNMCRFNSYSRTTNIAYALIIGGASGNLFDRIMYGAVIDFIDVYLGNFHCPIFNIADSSIFIGAMIIMMDNFFIRKTMISSK